MEHYANIDEYIAKAPETMQELLVQMRETIRKAAPEAVEALAYGMPTFRLKGNLVHFAAQRKHIGFYPAPSAIEKFKEELKEYKWSKGAVQFPLDKPLPLDLVERMVRFRVEEQMGKEKQKGEGPG